MKKDIMVAGISITLLGFFMIMYYLFFDTNMTIQYGEEVVFVVLGVIAFGIVMTIFGYDSKSDESNKGIKKKYQPTEESIAMRELEKRRWVNKKEEPIEILNIRYAKGEITEKEFENMKKKLEG